MRILLVGEYSNFHNSLKEGLITLGHQVVICSDNDFKNYPADYSTFACWFKTYFFLNLIRQFIFKISKVDLAQWEAALRFFLLKKHFKNFDVVQLVNEYPLQTTPYLDKKILSFLFKKNKNVFLASCGDDYPSVTYMLNGDFKYSVLTPCLQDPNKTHCQYTLRYVAPAFKKLHDFIYQNIKGVIAGDVDYYIPLKNHPKCLGLIPYPINLNKIKPLALPPLEPVVVFHGINRVNYYKKGNDYFEKALQILEERLPNRFKVITTESLPYQEYIHQFNQAHIVLDQVLSYDQGYNALEAMAKGKVVFTGAETEFLIHYNLTEKVCINALPDPESIAQELAFLIENPQEIIKISQNARAFVEKEHDYVKIAERYLGVWTNHCSE